MLSELLYYSLIIFIVAIAGGLLAILKRWSDEHLHIFVSFGAGIFIGTVFLHLLPEAFDVSNHDISAIFTLIGFMFIFFIERFLLLNKEFDKADSHKVISITALVGLSIHSLIAGMGLTIVEGSTSHNLANMVFYSILAHKGTASFALMSLFLLARLSIKKSLLLILMFSLMTPLGILVLSNVNVSAESPLMDALLGMTAGTFLYVSVGELLPEVFHTDKNKWMKLGILILGIVIILILGEGNH